MWFTHSKEKIEKIDFSSHKLSKQQSTSFWSQGILGVNNINTYIRKYLILIQMVLVLKSF
jgi:hypothetical protein